MLIISCVLIVVSDLYSTLDRPHKQYSTSSFLPVLFTNPVGMPNRIMQPLSTFQNSSNINGSTKLQQNHRNSTGSSSSQASSGFESSKVKMSHWLPTFQI